jgi:hypothetical protein
MRGSARTASAGSFAVARRLRVAPRVGAAGRSGAVFADCPCSLARRSCRRCASRPAPVTLQRVEHEAAIRIEHAWTRLSVFGLRSKVADHSIDDIACVLRVGLRSCRASNARRRTDVGSRARFADRSSWRPLPAELTQITKITAWQAQHGERTDPLVARVGGPRRPRSVHHWAAGLSDR